VGQRHQGNSGPSAPNYPMIGDTDLKVAKLYGMLPATLQLTAKHKVATPVSWKQATT
jgi:alkyl hydroperoxide reductase subunit AhpC